MESDYFFLPLESAIYYKFLMFQKIPYRERLLASFFIGGGEESRTPVLHKNRKVFYILSLLVDLKIDCLQTDYQFRRLLNTFS